MGKLEIKPVSAPDSFVSTSSFNHLYFEFLYMIKDGNKLDLYFTRSSVNLNDHQSSTVTLVFVGLEASVSFFVQTKNDDVKEAKWSQRMIIEYVWGDRMFIEEIAGCLYDAFTFVKNKISFFFTFDRVSEREMNVYLTALVGDSRVSICLVKPIDPQMVREAMRVLTSEMAESILH